MWWVGGGRLCWWAVEAQAGSSRHMAPHSGRYCVSIRHTHSECRSTHTLKCTWDQVLHNNTHTRAYARRTPAQALAHAAAVLPRMHAWHVCATWRQCVLAYRSALTPALFTMSQGVRGVVLDGHDDREGPDQPPQGHGSTWHTHHGTAVQPAPMQAGHGSNQPYATECVQLVCASAQTRITWVGGGV